MGLVKVVRYISRGDEAGRKYILQSITLVLLTFGTAHFSSVYAADITVTTGQTVGQQRLFDGDTLTVQPGGTVSHNGNAVFDNADGISATIVNDGLIEATNGAVDFIDSDLSMINNGSIVGSSSGVVTLNIEFLVNTGVIRATAVDPVADAVLATDLRYLFNSGTISSAGAQAVDIDRGTIINFGTLIGVNGIEDDSSFGGPTTITNHGQIISRDGTSGQAIDIQRAGTTTLNIMPGSQIIGQVSWDGADDTLNLGTGFSGSVTTTDLADTITFDSPVQFQNGSTSTQLDTSTLAAVGDTVAGQSQRVGQIVQQRLDDVFASHSEASSDPNQLSFSSTYRNGGYLTRRAWIEGWGHLGTRSAESLARETDYESYGTVFGMDVMREDGTMFGVFGGASLGSIDVQIRNGTSTDSESYYGGVYARGTFGSLGVNASFSAGWLDFDSDTPIANNQVATGLTTSSWRTQGWYIAPSLGLSHQFDVAGQSVVASARVGYTGIFLDGYAVSDGINTISVSGQDIHQFDARGQLAIDYAFTGPGDRPFRISPYVGVSGWWTPNDGSMHARMLAQSITFDVRDDDFVGQAFWGLRANAGLSDGLTLYGSLEAGLDTDGTATGNARLGLSFTF